MICEKVIRAGMFPPRRCTKEAVARVTTLGNTPRVLCTIHIKKLKRANVKFTEEPL